jgi:hypothetical protein
LSLVFLFFDTFDTWRPWKRGVLKIFHSTIVYRSAGPQISWSDGQWWGWQWGSDHVILWHLDIESIQLVPLNFSFPHRDTVQASASWSDHDDSSLWNESDVLMTYLTPQ